MLALKRAASRAPQKPLQSHSTFLFPMQKSEALPYCLLPKGKCLCLTWRVPLLSTPPPPSLPLPVMELSSSPSSLSTLQSSKAYPQCRLTDEVWSAASLRSLLTHRPLCTIRPLLLLTSLLQCPFSSRSSILLSYPNYECCL